MANINNLQYLDELSFENFTNKIQTIDWNRGDNVYLIIGACFYSAEIVDLSGLDIDTVYICQGCNFDNIILPENFIFDEDNTNKLIKYFEGEGDWIVDIDGNKLELLVPVIPTEVF
jgi:hypothetical protein